jgi:predicted DNA-binding transcriptional regulator AlpA
MKPITDRFMRLTEVIDVIGLSRTTIWRMEKAGAFPRRFKLGTSSIAWREKDIIAWMDSRPLA